MRRSTVFLVLVYLCLFALSEANVGGSSVARTLFRGASLRVASDITGGTAFESIKTRVSLTTEGPIEATRKIVEDGGFLALWRGSSSRMVEGSLIGALFLLGSSVVKKQVLQMGASKPIAALAGGVAGGVAQAFVMTPAGLIFTSLNQKRKGYENDTALSIIKRTVQEKGILGMYNGFQPMCLRQATNWASRSTFTEVIRASLGKYGLAGELGSGAIGGVLSCWNTPIETIRVLNHRDASLGLPPKTMSGYWNEIMDRDGFPGLYRGVTPRALQAIWQTCFLVVVPNLLGL